LNNILIKYLCEFQCYGAQKLIKEFPTNGGKNHFELNRETFEKKQLKQHLTEVRSNAQQTVVDEANDPQNKFSSP